jgi:hypothetical protein
VRVVATPINPAEGAKLAEEVLATLREAAGVATPPDGHPQTNGAERREGSGRRA